MNEYKSTLTPEEVDAAFKNIALVEAGIESANTAANAAAQSASQAESSANSAAESQQQAASSASAAGQSAEQSASSASAAAQSASQAADSASAAGSSQQQAAASASASAQSASQAATAQQQATASASAAAQSQQQAASSAEAAQAAADQAQQISQGALGWYATPQALQSAHPTGQNGQWAIVGSTDTIWTWDSDTSAWVNTGSQMDLSGYYTKEQADERFATSEQGVKADSAVQSVNGVRPGSSGAVTIPIGTQMKLLWTNSNPEASFTAKSVSVSLSGYDFAIVVMKNPGLPTFLFKGQRAALVDPMYTSAWRYATASNSGIQFEAGNYWKGYAGESAVDNGRCKPWKIFGVKL